MPFHDDVVGRPGFLHGGAIAGLLEFAAFTALRALTTRTAMKPITVTVDYMRGGTPRTPSPRRHRAAGQAHGQCRGYAWQASAKPIASARINFLLERLNSR